MSRGAADVSPVTVTNETDLSCSGGEGADGNGTHLRASQTCATIRVNKRLSGSAKASL